MKSLELIHRILTIIGICATEDETSSFQTTTYIIIGITVSTLNVVTFITHAGFVIKSGTADVQSTLSAIFGAFAIAPGCYIMISTLFFRQRNKLIFQKLQNIYDEYEASDSFKYFLKADIKSRYFTQMLVYVAAGGFAPILIIMGVFNVASCYSNEGYINPAHLIKPYRLVVPWGQENIFGWMYTLIFSMIGGGTYLLTTCAFLSYFISICLYFTASRMQFESYLFEIDRQHSEETFDTQFTKQMLVNAIQFHNSIKSIFNDVADVFSGYLFVLRICGIIHLSSSLFLMDMILRHMNIGILIALNSIFTSIITFYLYSYYGNLTTSHFASYADCLYHSEWNELPDRLQKHFVIMIEFAQQPIYFTGFGMVTVSLETFMKILNAVISWYLLFKTVVS